jgi:alpha-L-glutamate ligase-like protein
MGSMIERLRWVRREALGLNRRNQQFLLQLNPAPLVALVDHKVQTKEVLARQGLPVPDTFGRYVRQRDIDLLAHEVERRAQFALKPARGAGGEGVVVIAGRTHDRLVKASGGQLRLGDLLAHAADIIAGAFSLSQARDEAILERRLAPEPVLARYSSGGIPDVRVLVVRGVPVMAMLRLPTRASDGRANLHVGGVGVGIDLASGRAVHAICRDRSIVLHPDTQRPLSAVQVPCWDEVLRLAAHSYDAIPLGYFGIDIVIDVQLGPVILELNARPGLSIQLANHRGLRRVLDELGQPRLQQLAAAERVAQGIEIVRRVRESCVYEGVES